MKKIYRKGARKEYAICEKLRKEGYDIVQRTAGSHSPIDIIAIKIRHREIKLIQSKRVLSEKMAYIPKKLKEKLEEENKEINGFYLVDFEVL